MFEPVQSCRGAFEVELHDIYVSIKLETQQIAYAFFYVAHSLQQVLLQMEHLLVRKTIPVPAW